jgi:hypothetical protein
MTKKNFVRPSFKTRLKIQNKSEFIQNFIYICSRDYETIHRVLWGSERFDAETPQLWMELRATDIEWGARIRDILDVRDLRGVRGAALSLGAAT